ncbi:hypothetical protein ED208_12650 [Stagnimonas aquatica]|uniref:DUF1834 family protein n=1 Tax=Stagnimonas aquatica TaxID=2689987 RepID=A0A3N0V7T1_9GAMM|nr:hypothetical protein [Stagnimonas aquatica]ROH88662.1 hypothetical protein ED208_12650 [Stagnimonas aquatica]
MDLPSYRAGLVTAIKAIVPDKVAVQAHPGRFDLAQLKTYALKAPCVLVALLNLPLAGGAMVSGPIEAAAYLLTKNVRGASHDEANLRLSDGLLQVMALQGLNGVACGGIRWGNLYNGALGDEGVSLSAIAFRQSLSLDMPEQGDLGDFTTLFALFDVANDGKPEAESTISIEGPSA